jgi:hypothetical protein
LDEEQISKINFPDATDFKFLAAYQKYSESFVKASHEDKTKLNDTISRLYNDEIRYSEFYQEITKLTGDPEERRRYRRASIKGTRKRAYRKEEQKKDRIQRHRK